MKLFYGDTGGRIETHRMIGPFVENLCASASLRESLPLHFSFEDKVAAKVLIYLQTGGNFK